ncbi:MAG: transferase spermidine synthase [Burkholderiales bacterium]
MGFLSLSGAVVDEKGTLRVREPRNTDLFDLAMRLLNGSYAKPFVIDCDGMRRLHFGLLYIQSEMEIADPVRLCAAYTRTMMACLLLAPDPGHVLIIGHGGGSLTKFCHRFLPHTRITAVDSSADVIAFGELFGVPPDDDRLTVVHEDALHFLGTAGEAFDVILLDLYDRKGPAALLGNEAFHERLAARLRPGGVLLSNLMGTHPVGALHVAALAAVFGGPPALLDAEGENNRVALAIRDGRIPRDGSAIDRRAAALAARIPLEFAVIARALQAAVGRSA